MLKLRRATVLQAGPADGPEQELTISLAGERRTAIADVGLVGSSVQGDDVIVNVQARDLGLGSGGFDIVHVNLSRGLAGEGIEGAHVMKLNYTSLQHAVQPVEELQMGPADGEVRSSHSGGQPEGHTQRADETQAGELVGLPLERPVAVLALHGQLAAVAWAFAQARPGARLGFVQTAGGALSGGHSRTVRTLLERGLLAGHLTAGAAYGGEGEAVSTAGALHHGLRTLGWDAAVCGPGPGIVGSNSSLGHGGMSALDSAHTAIALGTRTLLVARMSSADERPRHRGLSHHTLTVLDLLLEPVTVALPAGIRSPAGADLRASLGSVFGSSTERAGPQLELDVDRPARMARHDWRRAPVDMPAYLASGLPAKTMGRVLLEDPLFFGAALAGGTVLAGLCESAEAQAERSAG
ncbi:MAG TPA: DUF3866 family protein [Solirubrobacteraceae bacterium]|jgi:hypothetical protein|nr:DUF3866 family protein [Solirubrobacteraceae bacterium]